MSYFTFHLIFVVPPILLLAWLQRQSFTNEGRRARLALPLIALIAFVYTTPWDNYLVWRGIWEYGISRVVGTIGYVPVEEYLFFMLQPILTGLWLYWLLARDNESLQQKSSSILRVLMLIVGGH